MDFISTIELFLMNIINSNNEVMKEDMHTQAEEFGMVGCSSNRMLSWFRNGSPQSSETLQTSCHSIISPDTFLQQDGEENWKNKR